MGYEAEPPYNGYEMALSVAVMFVAIYLSAYILGTLFHYLVQKDPLADAHRKRIADVTEFSDSRKLAPDLKNKLIDYFNFQVMQFLSLLSFLPHSKRDKVSSGSRS